MIIPKEFRRPRSKDWARSSSVERCSDKAEVDGSIPSVPTSNPNLLRGIGRRPAPHQFRRFITLILRS